MKELDPAVAAFVRETVARQGFRDLLGYEVTAIGSGGAELTLVTGPQHGQQDGLIHGGVFATMADVCAGCAAITLAPRGTRVMTVEFKMSYLRPAKDGPIVARARVIKGGRSISVIESDILKAGPDSESLLAKALVTYTLFQPE